MIGSRNFTRFSGVLVSVIALMSAPASGWEIANDAGPGVVEVIGQSFRPSVQDEGDTFRLPRAANNLAFLSFLSFDVGSGVTLPNQVYLYSALPLVTDDQVTGDGAFATGVRSASGYEFNPPVAVPFDQLTYLVFPGCLEVPATLGSYPGGQSLIPNGGCGRSSDTKPIVTSEFDLDFFALFSNPEPSLVADYRFDQKDLTSFKGDAPPLVSLGRNGIISEEVLGQNRFALSILSGTGLQLSLNDQLSRTDYTLSVLLRINPDTVVAKLMDLSGLTSDDGVYVVNKAIVFRGDPDPIPRPPSVIKDDGYVQLTLARQQNTKSISGSAQGHVDSEQIFDFDNDPNDPNLDSSNVVLMRDDGRENTGGAIARVRLFEGQLSDNEIRLLEPLPPTTTDVYESDNTPFEADVGLSSGKFASYRTLHSNEDIDWIYVGDRCYTNNYYSASDGLHLHSDDPRFQPIVEVYGAEYLADTSAPPEAVYGACGQSNNIQFNPGPGHFSVRNCESVDIADEPIFYTVVPLNADFEVCGPISTIRGTVIDAATNEPVGGQFILGNSTSTSVSNPTLGDYAIAVTAGVMTLEVVSTEWEGAPVQIDTVPMTNYTGVDILVNRIPPPDDQPIAVTDNFSGSEDEVMSGDLAANDTLSEDGGNVFSLATDATRGAVSVTPLGQFSYEPDLNSNGPDSFSYRITDADGDVDLADVNLMVNAVNDAPEAVEDMASIDANSGPEIIDVLANDSDVDDDPLTISAVTQPANGTVVIDGSQTQLSYQPDQNYCNSGGTADTFSYTITDGSTNDQATVSITVPCTADILFSNGFEA